MTYGEKYVRCTRKVGFPLEPVHRQIMRNKHMTYGEKYSLAMEITDQDAADVCFEKLVADTMSHGLTRTEAEQIERSNLGYWAGYYTNEVRERVERLFSCQHPVFGSITEKGPPTAEFAFQAGLKRGMQIRQGLNERDT